MKASPMTQVTGFLRSNGVLVLVALLLAVAPLYTSKFILGLLIQVFILAVFALSYDLLLGYSGILSFGHAMFFGGGAYVAAILLKGSKAEVFGTKLNIAPQSLPVVVLGIIVLAVLLGLLVGIVTMRVRGVYFAMVTLALAEVIYILAASSELRPLTGGDEGLHGVPALARLSPSADRTNFYLFTLAFFLVMFFLARRLVNSPAGRVLVAIRDNEARASAIGYNVLVYKMIIIIVAGIFAALAGGLNALFFRNATPEVLGAGRTIEVLLMTIVGGAGTLTGPVLGAVTIRLLGNYLADWFGQRWTLVFGLLFIVLVLFFPYGIVGTWNMRKANLRQGWERLLRLLRH